VARRLAIAAILAVAATMPLASAPAASAAGVFEVGFGFATGTITGEQINGTITGLKVPEHEFHTAAGVLKCKTVKFDGKVAGLTAMLTVTPSVAGCTLGGQEASVQPKGCDFEIIAGNTIDPKNSDKISVEPSITCGTAEGEPDEIRVNVLGTECELEIPGQSLKPAGTAENTTTALPKADVDVTIDAEDVAYTITHGASCPNEPANGEHVDGEYRGVTTFRAEEISGAGNPLPFNVT